jgi:replicative DNA helicase
MQRENKRKNVDTVLYGKVPPQAPEMEESVLGAIMIDKDALITVIDIIKPEIFYDDRNGLVCEAMLSLFRKTQPIDLLTITEELREMGKLEEAGGVYYITQLTNRVASAAHIEHHARIIVQKHISREIIRVSSEATRDAYEDTTDVLELLQTTEKAIYDIASKRSKNAKNIGSVISANMEKIKHMKENPDLIAGVHTGLEGLDRVTGGWQKTDLIIVAARPSMGKTAFVVTVSANAAIDFGVPVAVFSLEMSEEQIGNRILSLHSEVDQENIKRGYLSDTEMWKLNNSGKEISKAPIYIDDTPSLSVLELRAKARRMKMRYGIQLIVVDYLQLMTVGVKKGQSREGEVSEISRTLKAIAKELEIPVIALSQLSRKVEDRGGSKKPMLSDLRESGAIEQDADIVIFLHRPEYYGIDVDENGESTQGAAELIIAKHRNGALENVKVSFQARFTKFTNYRQAPVGLKPVKNYYEKEGVEEEKPPF